MEKKEKKAPAKEEKKSAAKEEKQADKKKPAAAKEEKKAAPAAKKEAKAAPAKKEKAAEPKKAASQKEAENVQLKTTSDPICASSGCTQYLHPEKEGHPMNYPVPDFGVDIDIKASMGHMNALEKDML